MGKFKAPPEEPITVPTWVLTFGDMVTNLMACFVMLQALATTQDHTLFNQGLGSFRRAVAQFGLPDWMFGKDDRPEHGQRMQHHPTEDTKTRDLDNLRRIIDAEDEFIRQQFKKLQDELETRSDNLPTKAISEVLTPLTFADQAAELTAQDQRWLETFCDQLKRDIPGDDVTIYAVGLSVGKDGSPGSAENRLAARRAGAVETALRRLLAVQIERRRWQVDSWSTCAEEASGPQQVLPPAIVIFIRGKGSSHGN